jgi:hypothetical protein
MTTGTAKLHHVLSCTREGTSDYMYAAHSTVHLGTSHVATCISGTFHLSPLPPPPLSPAPLIVLIPLLDHSPAPSFYLHTSGLQERRGLSLALYFNIRSI